MNIQPILDQTNQLSDRYLMEEETTCCDEQQLREELIQRATTRLRRRLLEEGLADVMKEVVRMQAELESLRMDTAATIESVNRIMSDTSSIEGSERMNRQIEVLERRLNDHQQGLSHFSQKKEEVMTPSLTALSMSRLSSLSLMSTLFGHSESNSSKATSVSEDIKKKSRRQRVKEYQQNTYEEEEDDEKPFYDLAGRRSFTNGSFCGSVYYDKEVHPLSEEDYQSFYEQEEDYRSVYEQEEDDQWTIGSPPIGLYPQRPVLEEAMSFLDGLSEDGDDCGLAEDLRVLLSNPCLFNRPLSEIESTIHQLRQDEHSPSWNKLIQPSAWCHKSIQYTSSAVYKVTCSSLEWCKFLSVLSAAVVISVLNGPEDMRT